VFDVNSTDFQQLSGITLTEVLLLISPSFSYNIIYCIYNEQNNE